MQFENDAFNSFSRYSNSKYFCMEVKSLMYCSNVLPELAVPSSRGSGDGCSQFPSSDAQCSRLCLAYDRCLRFGMHSDRRREVLCSPHKRENLEASLPEQFVYSWSHSSSLRKALGRKWQDKSFGLHYSEQMCGLWISHAHSSIYIYHC